MDVSNPSNFVRILEIIPSKCFGIEIGVSSYSYNDLQTKKRYKTVF